MNVFFEQPNWIFDRLKSTLNMASSQGPNDKVKSWDILNIYENVYLQCNLQLLCHQDYFSEHAAPMYPVFYSKLFRWERRHAAACSRYSHSVL